MNTTGTRMVKLRNTLNKRVGVRFPEFNINRTWETKGQIIPIPFEVVEQLLWNKGFENMIKRGILYIEDMQDKIDLGLEEEGTDKPTNIVVLTDGEIDIMIKKQPYEKFVEKVSNLNTTQVDNIINYMINNEVVDVQKCAYLKSLTGTDILKIISMRRDADEAAAREKAKIKK